jgi:hypothetical protein
MKILVLKGKEAFQIRDIQVGEGPPYSARYTGLAVKIPEVDK